MRVAIYARVSTEKQEKQETVNSQLEALRDFANKNNYTIHQEYIDEGYSGELLDRPALDRLRDDAKNKLFEAVLIHSPDRLSRKYIYSGLVQEELKKSGINVIFLNRPDSKDTPEDNLLNGVQGLIAEFEKAKITERTRRGRLYKAKSGFLVTGKAPYGYTYIRIDRIKNTVGRYEIVEKEAKVVRLIFDLFVGKRLSIRAIAKELTRRGIPPRQGEHWQPSSLHRVVRNETYTGTTYYNKHVLVEAIKPKNGNKYRRTRKTSLRLKPRDQWIAITLPDKLKIIDKQTFELAQKQLKKNVVLSPRNVKYQYLLRGLIQCGNCDSPFSGTPCHGVLYYRCGNRGRTFPLPAECKVPSVKTEALDQVVWDKFCEAIKDPRLITEQIPKLKEKAVKNTDSIVKDIESLDKDLKDTGNEESRLLDAYRENILSIEQLKDQMTKIQEKKKQVEQEKQSLLVKRENGMSPSAARKTIYDYCQQIEKRLDGLKDDWDGKRYLLSRAVNRIVLNGKQVRIKGIIPAYRPQETFAIGNIASTISEYYACHQPLPPALF